MTIRHDWTPGEVLGLLDRSFHELLAEAHRVHVATFDTTEIEGAVLLSIKTGACPEDCAYCPQSARYNTGVGAAPLMDVDQIVAAATCARDSGATRFCVGAAWRSPTDRQVRRVAEAIEQVAALGVETCATLGMLTTEQARILAEAGLDYYNHNLDTSPQFYGHIVTTRTYDARLATIAAVRAAGIKVCCGGIVGMGETRADRAGLLQQLAQMNPHPESVPINLLVQMPGTPLYGTAPLDGLELVRTVAAARLLMPKSVVRLSAGRMEMSDELQALCFHAGANSIFLGETLLTAPNSTRAKDDDLLARLGTRLATAPLQGG